MSKSCKGGRRKRSNFRKIGRKTTRVLSKGVNLAEKGVANVYNVLNSGFNLGVKGVKSVLSRRRTRRHRRR